jgi:hypothetical protein
VNIEPEPSEFRLTLRAEKGAKWQAPGIVRLRRFLKCALRAFGLRCVDARPAPSPENPAPRLKAGTMTKSAPEAKPARKRGNPIET